MVNDEFARDVQERSPRFAAFATLPLNDPKASVVEFRRAVEQLGFPGAMLFSNVNGVALADERFWPLYEAANELGAVLHIHPTNPVDVEAMKAVLADAARRIPVRHDAGRGAPRLQRRPRALPAHQVGAEPSRRRDSRISPSGSIAATRRFPECRANISKPPSEYLRTLLLRHGELRPACARARA